MIIVLRPKTEESLITQVEAEVKKLGYEPRLIRGEIQTVIAAIDSEFNARRPPNPLGPYPHLRAGIKALLRLYW